jgi:GNAT superfamily N-acetyltransferase
MEIVIRQGVKGDLPIVLNLIQELAEYEQAPHEVEVTLAELERDFEGIRPYFNFFAAEVDGKMVGMALYFIKYSSWKGKCVFLDDIIVAEKYRGRGVGRLLFNELIMLAKEMGMKKVEWMVLDWNDTAINFYQKFPAVLDSEWISCRLTEQEIKNFDLNSLP